jgi:hypothetical protein
MQSAGGISSANLLSLELLNVHQFAMNTNLLSPFMANWCTNTIYHSIPYTSVVGLMYRAIELSIP